MVRSLVIGLACAVLCAAAPAALAAEGDPYVTACLTRATAVAGCAGGLSSSPIGVALSPDGRQLYAAVALSSGASAIQVFDRDAAGAVAPRAGGCYGGSGATSVQCAAAVTGTLTGSRNVAVSPDGRSVYLTSTGTVSLVAFTRDPGTGALTFRACAGSAPECTLPGLSEASGLAVGAGNVYVKFTNGLMVYDRDGVTLGLTQRACFGEAAGCTPAAGLTGAPLGALALAGAHLYVPFSNGVSVFLRSPDGGLTPIAGTAGGCISAGGGACAPGSAGLATTQTVAASPDGASVYVGSASGIFAFRRDAATGLLTAGGCVGTGPGCVAAAGGVGNVWSLAVTPDGRDVVAAAYTSSSLTFFHRDGATGALTQRAGGRGCFTAAGVAASCLALAGLGSGGQVAVDPSGLFVYAAGFTQGMLATLVRDFAPVCAPVAVSVPFNTAVSVPLTCSDVNGDALVLERVGGPAAGQLGEISGGRVFYNPFGGYSGPDAFTFRAVTPARPGVASAPATVSLSVAGPVVVNPGGPPPPPAPTPPAKRPTLTAGVAHQWTVKGSRLTLTTLKVTQQFPKGWKAKIRCTGKRCPFKAKTLKAGKVRRGAASILGSLSARQRRFQAGQTVEVWVSAPGFNTKVARFKLAKSKIPQAQPLCVAAGAKKPQRRCD